MSLCCLDTCYEKGASAQANAPKRPHVCPRAASGIEARACSRDGPVVTGATAAAPRGQPPRDPSASPWGHLDPGLFHSWSWGSAGPGTAGSDLWARSRGSRSSPGTQSHPTLQHAFSVWHAASLGVGVSSCMGLFSQAGGLEKPTLEAVLGQAD